MTTIILITGLAGSGKSTIAEYITEHYDFKNFALGDKVKELTFKLLQTFGIPINSIQDLYTVETKKKYRHYLQQIATECMRSTFGDDFWCEQLNNIISHEDKVIISDVRFMNEADFFKSHYGNIYTIKIIKPDIVAMNHRSEQEIGNISPDFIIYNDKDFKGLFAEVDNIMNIIMK